MQTGVASSGHPPGSGRWDDFARHPKDGRLISVEGDNGDLSHIDPAETPVKSVLKRSVLEPAEAGTSAGSRRSYSAMLFDTVGNLYAVDSAGNVSHLDLTSGSVPEAAERIGNGRLSVDGLEVMNGAGLIREMPAEPSYDEITVIKESNPPGRIPSPGAGCAVSS